MKDATICLLKDEFLLCQFDLWSTRRKQDVPVWKLPSLGFGPSSMCCVKHSFELQRFLRQVGLDGALSTWSCARNYILPSDTVLQCDTSRLQFHLSFLHSLFMLISGSHFNIFRASKKLKVQRLQRNKAWALFPDRKVPGSYGGWRLAITCSVFIAFEIMGSLCEAVGPPAEDSFSP